ncbi:MAG TPA: hypothetical protein VFX22_10495 [Candidatus Kapabacteria bacterium]|nr:hypothetical protein [Candidatus Kapabacteria bacterium]
MNEVFDAAAEKPKDVLVAFEYDGARLEAKNKTLTLVLDRDIHRSIEHASCMAVSIAKKFSKRNVLLINTYAGMDLLQQSLVAGMIASDLALPKTWKYRGYTVGATENWVEPEAAKLPPNLRVLNCPYSTLTAKLMDSEITAHKCDIVVLNSFEFASLSSYAKSLLASGLLDLLANKKLSLLVYSQDRHRGLSTFSLGRGAIGSLAPYSAAIWRIYDN